MCCLFLSWETYFGGVGTHKLLLRGQPSPTIPAQRVDLCHMAPTFLSHLGYMVQPQQKTLEFESRDTKLAECESRKRSSVFSGEAPIWAIYRWLHRQGMMNGGRGEEDQLCQSWQLFIPIIPDFTLFQWELYIIKINSFFLFKFVGFIAPCNSNHKLFLLFNSNNLTSKPQFDSGGKTWQVCDMKVQAKRKQGTLVNWGEWLRWM